MPDVELSSVAFEISAQSKAAVDSVKELRKELVEMKTALRGGFAGMKKSSEQLRGLAESLHGFNKVDSVKIKSIAFFLSSLNQISGVRIPKELPESLRSLSKSLGSIKGTNPTVFAQLAAGVVNLSAVSDVRIPASIGKNIASISDAASKITPETLEKINALSSTFASMPKLERGSAWNQLARLPKVIEKLKPEDIEKFADQMERLSTAMRPFADEMVKVAAGFDKFPSRIQRLIRSTEAYNRTVSNAGKETASWGMAMGGLKFGIIYHLLDRVTMKFAQLIDKSNSYQENLNLFTVAMGKYARESLAFGERAGSVLGIDPSDWIRSQGVFQTLLTGFGNAEGRAAKMSKQLTQLGYDLSSFFNLPIGETMQKLEAGISGELEPLRRLGFDLSQAKLQAIATASGIDKLVSEMTQAEKSELRYYAIMTQVTNAHGDMARTLEAPANQLRVLKAQFAIAGRAIGNIFIPALNAILPVATAVVQIIGELANSLAKIFGFKVTEIDYSDLESGIGGAVDNAEELEDHMGGAAGAAQKLKQYMLGFDELNVFDPSTGVSGGGGGGGGGAIGGGDGLGLEIPEYDFLGKAKESANEIKQKIKEILPIIRDIGLGILAWKVSGGLADFIKNISSGSFWSKKRTMQLGIALTVTGFATELTGLTDALQDGLNSENLLKILGGGGNLTLGTGLISKFLFGSMTPGLAGGGLVLGIPAFFTGIYDAITEGINWLSAMLIPGGSTVAGAGIGALIGSGGGPIGAFVGGLVGLVADLGIYIYQNWEEIKESFSHDMRWISTKASEVWGNLSSWFSTNVKPYFTRKYWSDLFGGIKDGAIAWWSGTKSWFSSKWQSVKDWYSSDIKPYFTEEYWLEVFDGIGSGASAWWSGIKNWTSEKWNGAISWFNETVKPKFTKEYWAGVLSGIQTGMSEWWSGVKSWPSEKWGEITKWFNETVKPKFTKEYWKNILSGVKEGIESGFHDAVNAASTQLNKLIDWMNDKLHISFPGIKINGVTYGAFERQLFTVPHIPQFASGGFPEQGSLFIAREAGPEMVGTIGGRTAVANSGQIVQSVSQGVRDANQVVVAAIDLLTRIVDSKNVSVNISDDDIGRSYDRFKQSRGAELSHGPYANAY